MVKSHTNRLQAWAHCLTYCNFPGPTTAASHFQSGLGPSLDLSADAPWCFKFGAGMSEGDYPRQVFFNGSGLGEGLFAVHNHGQLS